MQAIEKQDGGVRGRFLGRAVLGNAVFSGVAGVLLIAGATWIGGRVGLDPWVLIVLGFGLVAYAAVLVFSTRSDEWLLRGARFAVAADAAWVTGAVALVAFTDTLAPAGEVALLVITAVVAGFGVAQAVGVIRFEDAGVPTP